MSKLSAAARKAAATFIFATTGCLVGFNVMALDVAVWETALATGLGALLNLAFRWSEAALRDHA
jgi:hypothetical protein